MGDFRRDGCGGGKERLLVGDAFVLLPERSASLGFLGKTGGDRAILDRFDEFIRRPRRLLPRRLMGDVDLPDDVSHSLGRCMSLVEVPVASHDVDDHRPRRRRVQTIQEYLTSVRRLQHEVIPRSRASRANPAGDIGQDRGRESDPLDLGGVR